MVVTLTILMLLTLGLAALVVGPRTVARQVVFDEAPDTPAPFGPEMAWLAVKTTDTAALLQALALTEHRAANWQSGIGTIYDAKLGDGHVFVTPPVAGWTFVAGVALPMPAGPNFVDKLMPMLEALAPGTAQVQYFGTFPSIDYFAWARFDGGRLVRAFAIGEAGVLWSAGRQTSDEVALGLRMYDVRGIERRKGDAGGALHIHPTQAHVLRLARAWGLSPLAVDCAGAGAATGHICRVPASWRPERIKRKAA